MPNPRKEYLLARGVYEITINMTYADTTAVLLTRLPVGARFLGYFFNVKTAFVDGTTTASLGTTTTATELVSGESVAAAGNIDLGAHLVLAGYETTVVTDIYGIVGGSNTAGSVDVTILFGLARDTRR